MHASALACVGVSVSALMPEVDVRDPPPLLSALLLRYAFSPEPELTSMISLDNQLVPRILHLLFPSAGIIHVSPYPPGISHGSGDLNAGAHIYIANSSTTDLFPQSLGFWIVANFGQYFIHAYPENLKKNN